MVVGYDQPCTLQDAERKKIPGKETQAPRHVQQAAWIQYGFQSKIAYTRLFRRALYPNTENICVHGTEQSKNTNQRV